MAIFSYRGRDAQGKLMTGQVEAATQQAVAEQLLKRNIIPMTIAAKGLGGQLSNSWFSSLLIPEVKPDELIIFCHQMATLLKAGVPLLDSLNKLAQTTSSKRLKMTLEGVISQLSEGKSLSTSLKNYPKVFPPIFFSMVDAGENSGKLDIVFARLAEYTELELETKKRIKKAVRYPISVLIAVTVAMLVINFFVVPSFEEMFSSFGGELPLPTKILIGSSKFLTAYWPYLLVAVVALVFAIRYAIGTPGGRYTWDRIKLKIPVIGGILQRIMLARFFSSLTMIVRAGVPIVDGLGLVASTTGNSYITRRLLDLRNAVSSGSSFSQAIIDSRLFTPLATQMLQIGEESGMVDKMMEEVSGFYEGQVDYDLSRMSDAIEPILLVFIAGMVLLLLLAVFLPMWSMVDFAK